MSTSFNDDIVKAIEVLRSGGIILYPTDTIWGIGCDATNPDAVRRIYEIKQRIDVKSMLVLMENPNLLNSYIAEVPEIAWDLIEVADNPLTIIYPNAQNLPKNVVADDNSIAIRIVKEEFCIRLIRSFGKPIVSSSANISGEPAPLVFKCVSKEILKGVDYVVNLYQDRLQEVKPSRIIKLNENGEFNIIRP